MQVYLDNAATTNLRKEVLEKITEIYEKTYANPSSVHSFGRESRALLENARNRVAKNLNILAKDIIFTSGATESNNLAIRGIVNAKGKDKEIICSSIEHSSILNLVKQLELEGYIVKYIRVNENGIIDLEHLKSLINENTGLITVMAVNNEIGSIQPIEKISDMIKGKNIHFHVDAVQMIGKKELKPYELGIDSMSISFHKLYGPKGVGVLYIKDNIEIKKAFYGGEQERNKRPGTENLHSILLADIALDYAINNMEKESKYVKELMDYLVDNIKDLENIKIHGENRIDNILNISIKGKNIQMLLPILDMRGIYVSGGSACMSGSVSGSYVLKNMGLSEDEVMSSIRISLGIHNTKEEIDYLISVIKGI
ncbi:cysteine desulfurase family protein [Oceanivirga miroungae]|uniref:Class V aminotransferase n=1 Tax=Oceanivirga miroungae TaxID=1130046 RepID=A0A6I8M659_9FUSO|nr:cysteine desulfurase family protein [Oceanivirga miroungae]VWL84841.1 class V aminotransferase [Oceanivirga miroungae]